MRFLVLGPLEVWSGRHRITLGGAKQRSLLAILLLERGRMVATDRLIEELWRGQAPETARKSVQKYVSQLRDLLGADRIETFERGYAVRLAEGELDLDSFEHLHEVALTEGAKRRSQTLRRALALVRGQPLADLHGEEWVEAATHRINERILTTTEDCHEAELNLGQHSRLLAELDQLVSSYPFRERSLEHYMIALYRSGLQADALAVSRTATNRLRHELGLDPARLRELERRILNHDPALAGTSSSIVRWKQRSTSFRFGAATLIVATGALAALAWRPTSGHGAALNTLRPSIVLLDGQQGKVIAKWKYFDYRYPWATTGNGKFWLASFTNGFTEFDPKTGAIERRLLPPFGTGTNLALIRGKTIWFTGTTGLARYDVAANRVSSTYHLFHGRRPVGLFGIAYLSGSVWVTDVEKEQVVRVDPATGAVLKRIDVPKPWWISSGDGGLWVTSQTIGVERIDAKTNRVVAVTPIAHPRDIDRVVVGGGFAWATNLRSGTLVKIDDNGHVVASYRTGRGAHEPSYSAGQLWVTNQDDGTLVSINARTGTKRVFTFGHPLGTAASIGRYVMVAITPGSLSGSDRGPRP